MTDRYLDIGDTTIFVDDRGHVNAPAVVYVHGGPGTGCFDFMYEQGDRLGHELRLIGVDQRGLLRSGPVGAAPLTGARIVSDLEGVRKALDIDQWSVLGHSSGGALALDYALANTEAVMAVIFDCPCWDCDDTDRHRLPVAARLLDRYGKPEQAAHCREVAAIPRRFTSPLASADAMQALDEHYPELFFADLDVARGFEDARAASGFGAETWARGRNHAPLLEEMYINRMPLLVHLRQPSLVILGHKDLVCTPAMIARYQSDVSSGGVHVFEHSAHFPSHEEPDAYADVIATFVLETQQSKAGAYSRVD